MLALPLGASRSLKALSRLANPLKFLKLDLLTPLRVPLVTPLELLVPPKFLFGWPLPPLFAIDNLFLPIFLEPLKVGTLPSLATAEANALFWMKLILMLHIHHHLTGGYVKVRQRRF